MTVVSNSSPLISLAKIESFHLLQQLYGTMLIYKIYAAGSRLVSASETANAAWVQVRARGVWLEVSDTGLIGSLGKG